MRAVMAVRMAQGMSAITRNQKSRRPAIERCMELSGERASLSMRVVRVVRVVPVMSLSRPPL